jgi:hypothetical protein
MANTDFTTWTEYVDDNNSLSRTAARTTIVNLRRIDSAVQYKDMGVSYISGNYTHYFEAYIDSNGVHDAVATLGFSTDNTRDGRQIFDLGTGSWEGCWGYDWTGINRQLRPAYVHNGALNVTTNTVALADDTLYYCTLTRTNNNLNIKIYSDSNRTVLVDNKTVALPTANDYRYAHIGGWDDNNSAAKWFNGYYQNYDFGETVVGIVNLSRSRMANAGAQSRLSRGGIINAN